MMDDLRSRLSAKLLLSYLAIILLVAVILVSATQLTLPGAFDRHLAGMEPQMMGRQPDGPPMRMLDLYDNFRASFNDALTYALLASGLAALLVSLFFSRSVVAPLRAMMKASQRIAEGHYDERVRVSGSDELIAIAVIGKAHGIMAP